MSNLFAWKPGYNVDEPGAPDVYSNGKGGRMGMLTIELPDDYDAVQIGVTNGTAKKWGVDQIAVAPSASYGGDAATGSVAYDVNGVPLDQMLPVQWSNGGVNSQPGKGPTTMSLPLRNAASAGKTVLGFSTLVSAPAYGAISPAKGWSVVDGLGCIAAKTTITAMTATSITLSKPVGQLGCRPGQAIYLSDQSFGPLSQAIPHGPGKSIESLTFSDWVKMSSLPRIDGGHAVGASISGPGIAAGTSLVAMGYDTLTLSAPLAANLPAGSGLHLRVSATASGAIPAGSTSLTVTNTIGIRAGQTVQDGSARPTHVVSVAGQVVRIDTPTPTQINKGSAIPFEAPAWTSLASKAGDRVLHVPSTSAHALLHIRFFLTPSLTPSFRAPACAPDAVAHNVACETPLGIAPVWSLAGGQRGGAAIDGLNFVAAVGAGAGGAISESYYPTFFLRFQGRHPGTTLLGCGDFQLSGAVGSVSSEASIVNISAAAATATYPGTPISAVDTATVLDTKINFKNCENWMKAISPGIVLFQDYSNHNGGTVAQFQAKVQKLANQVLAYGGQPAIYLGYNEGTFQIGQMIVADNVANSATIPLLEGVNAGQAGTGLLVDGPGIPAGTTASANAGDWSIKLSRPATIPAGSVLNFAYQVASEKGKKLTLVYPSFETIGKVAVTGTNVAPHTKIYLHQGSTGATLNQNGTIAPGTMLGLSQATFNTPTSYYAAAAAYRSIVNQPWAAIQIDGPLAVSTGSLHDGPICNGCTTQGRYANDYGNSLIAAALTPVLERLTGH